MGGCGVGGDGPCAAVDDEDGVVGGGGSHWKQITAGGGRWTVDGGRKAVNGGRWTVDKDYGTDGGV